MIIEFENNTPIDEDFPNKNVEGSRWYVRKQECLMFKEGSKYPDKGKITPVFSDKKSDQQSVGCFTPGRYELTDSAFSFDSRNYDAPVCDFTQIKPVAVKAVQQKVS